jgi:hypothetical protein
MRAVKFLIGILLLPPCYVAARTLGDLMMTLRPNSLQEVSFEAWSLLGGFGFWLVFWFAMPKPVRAYVLGHELTHALWALLMGARVSRLKVSGRGGSVQLTKTNFLITLAPYFFPFYTVCVILGYGIVLLFVDLGLYQPFWLALIGLSWGFHATFTVTALLQRQTDIEANGHLFSYAIIFLFNVLGLCLWIVIVASPTGEQFETALRSHATAVGAAVTRGVQACTEWLAHR